MFRLNPVADKRELYRIKVPALKSAVDAAEAACGEEQVEKLLDHSSRVFHNYVLLLDSIGRTTNVLNCARGQLQEAIEQKSEARVAHNTKTVNEEQKKLDDFKASLQRHEEILCGQYVSVYRKAVDAGDEKQVLLYRAPITQWNILCDKQGLCSAPDYKQHGADAIFARHADKYQKPPEAKAKAEDRVKEQERETARRMAESAARQEKEAAERAVAEAKNQLPNQPPGGAPVEQLSPPGGPSLPSDVAMPSAPEEEQKDKGKEKQAVKEAEEAKKAQEAEVAKAKEQEAQAKAKARKEKEWKDRSEASRLATEELNRRQAHNFALARALIGAQQDAAVRAKADALAERVRRDLAQQQQAQEQKQQAEAERIAREAAEDAARKNAELEHKAPEPLKVAGEAEAPPVYTEAKLDPLLGVVAPLPVASPKPVLPPPTFAEAADDDREQEEKRKREEADRQAALKLQQQEQAAEQQRQLEAVIEAAKRKREAERRQFLAQIEADEREAERVRVIQEERDRRAAREQAELKSFAEAKRRNSNRLAAAKIVPTMVAGGAAGFFAGSHLAAGLALTGISAGLLIGACVAGGAVLLLLAAACINRLVTGLPGPFASELDTEAYDADRAYQSHLG